MGEWKGILSGWRCLHEPQPINNETFLKGFMMYGLDPILSGWRCLHEPQPINNETFLKGFMMYGLDPTLPGLR